MVFHRGVFIIEISVLLRGRGWSVWCYQCIADRGCYTWAGALQIKKVNKSYVYFASMLNRVSSWKQFLAGQPYTVTLPWPESVSEVSTECQFPAHLIKHQDCNGLTRFTTERDLELAKLVHTEVSDDWLPSMGKTKQPANDFVMSRCSSNPHLLWSSEESQGEGCA